MYGGKSVREAYLNLGVMVKFFLKPKGEKVSSISRTFKYLVFEKTVEELQDMIKPEAKEKLPPTVALIISAILSGIKTGTMEVFNAISDFIRYEEALKQSLKIIGIEYEEVQTQCLDQTD